MQKPTRILLLLIIIGIVLALYFNSYRHKEPEPFITLYGNVDIRQVDLGFRIKGKVDKLFFEEGHFVTKGTLMATLDQSPYLDQVKEARANLLSIQYSLENAQRMAKRRESLIQSGSISKESYQDTVTTQNITQANLEKAQAALSIAITNLQDTELIAPSDGIILTRLREPGSVVREADPIYTLSLTSPLWVRAFISEPYLGFIYPGMPAEIITDSRKDLPYKGHVGFISPVAEFTPKNVETMDLRTDLVYRLRVIVDGSSEGLRQGMPVTVRLWLEDNRRDQRNE